MKNVPLGIAGVAAATGLLLILSSSAQAQEGEEPQPIVSRALAATVDYGNDVVFQPAKQITDFDMLGVLPEAALTITVQFPVERAGQSLILEPLDGGVATVPETGLVIDANGVATFQFQVSMFTGNSRLSVHQADDSNFIQFWIVDPDHPENTPPDLPGVY